MKLQVLLVTLVAIFSNLSFADDPIEQSKTTYSLQAIVHSEPGPFELKRKLLTAIHRELSRFGYSYKTSVIGFQNIVRGNNIDIKKYLPLNPLAYELLDKAISKGLALETNPPMNMLILNYEGSTNQKSLVKIANTLLEKLKSTGYNEFTSVEAFIEIFKRYESERVEKIIDLELSDQTIKGLDLNRNDIRIILEIIQNQHVVKSENNKSKSFFEKIMYTPSDISDAAKRKIINTIKSDFYFRELKPDATVDDFVTLYQEKKRRLTDVNGLGQNGRELIQNIVTTEGFELSLEKKDSIANEKHITDLNKKREIGRNDYLKRITLYELFYSFPGPENKALRTSIINKFSHSFDSPFIEINQNTSVKEFLIFTKEADIRINEIEGLGEKSLNFLYRVLESANIEITEDGKITNKSIENAQTPLANQFYDMERIVGYEVVESVRSALEIHFEGDIAEGLQQYDEGMTVKEFIELLRDRKLKIDEIQGLDKDGHNMLKRIFKQNGISLGEFFAEEKAKELVTKRAIRVLKSSNVINIRMSIKRGSKK